jgi:hypothetical protein
MMNDTTLRQIAAVKAMVNKGNRAVQFDFLTHGLRVELELFGLDLRQVEHLRV